MISALIAIISLSKVFLVNRNEFLVTGGRFQSNSTVTLLEQFNSR
jgi:hypothetical protein